MADISVVGLGAMGSSLASSLLHNGYAVTVWNRTAKKMDPLVAAGATAADTVADALAASPGTITCLASHVQTMEVLQPVAESLQGKTVIELSTGGADEARALAQLISGHDADWLIGIINAYPTAIGKPETALTVVGAEEVWQTWQPFIKALGGASAHVGTDAAMLAALFAALFTTRQGFMFG